MTLDLMRKLVMREDIPAGKIVEILASHDPIEKQLTADYVAYTQHRQRRVNDSNSEDLGLLVTNLLLRDCRDANPSVAGSAVIALSAVPSVPDVTFSAINDGLHNSHQKVRRCSTLASMLLHTSHPEVALTSDLPDALYAKLRDSDPIVVANALCSLEHILSAEGGVVINRPIALYLLSKLHTFSDSSLEVVLKVLKKYVPRDNTELFERLLTPLDDCLKSDNPSVLVTAVELFLHWTAEHTHLKNDLLKVIQAPFCRMFMTATPETCNLLAEFLISLGSSIKNSFSPQFRCFCPKPNDPSYLKANKMKLLVALSSPSNVIEIITEILPYCSDFDSYNSAMVSLGMVGQVSEEARVKIYSALPEYLEGQNEKIITAALKCVLFLVSNAKTPKQYQLNKNKSTANVLSELCDEEVSSIAFHKHAANDSKSLSNSNLAVTTSHLLPPPLIAAIISALSRSIFADELIALSLHTVTALCTQLPNCVAVLEHFLSLQGNISGCTKAQIDTESLLNATTSKSSNIRDDNACTMTADTQCLLLMTVARVFLQRPAECYILLTRALQLAVNSQHNDVRDNAALVYSILKQGPLEASKILGVTTVESANPLVKKTNQR